MLLLFAHLFGMAAALSSVSVQPAPSNITVLGTTAILDEGIFRIGYLQNTDATSDDRPNTVLHVISDHTFVLQNATTLVGYFGGTKSVFSLPMAMHPMHRRSLFDGTGHQACEVRTWISPAFASAQGGYGSARRFAEQAVSIATQFLDSAHIGITLALSDDSGGSMSLPVSFGPSDKLFWLVDTVPTTGCVNIIFDHDPSFAGIAGIAFVPGACDIGSNWALINTLDPAAAGIVVAHEVAHLLDAMHDTPDCGTGFIMQAVLETEAFLFSVCSVDRMRSFVPTLSCLVTTNTETVVATHYLLVILCVASGLIVAWSMYRTK
jgi:hypothetical protein